MSKTPTLFVSAAAGVIALGTAVGVAQPANDECADATNLGTLPTVVSGSTTTAASETLGFCGTGDGTGGGVWYRVVGTGGQFIATTCPEESIPGDADYDTKIRVFTDCNATCVGGNDDSCSGLRSTVTWTSVPAQDYFILVHGFSDNTGNFTLSVFENAPGACCFFDGSCQLLAPSSCTNQGGTFGGAGSACAGAGCPDLTGACCFFDGTCNDTLDNGSCISQGGTFNGAGSDCGTTVCSDQRGACCFSSGACVVDLDDFGCTSQGGTFSGVGSDCAGIVCTPTTGACCFPNGSCDDSLTESQCNSQNGDFNGIGTPCSAVECPDLVNGADVVYTECTAVTKYGPVGDIYAFSLGSHTCNIGDEDLRWGNSWEGSPVLAMNAYRMNNGRLEQIGMSWTKHACCAAAGNGCANVSCNGVGGSELGIGCRDIYGAGYNAIQSNLGARSNINVYTGALTDATGSGSSDIDRRLQVHQTDLGNPGALYFVEGVYVGSDDAEAGNWLNNCSYKQVVVNGALDMSPTGPMYTYVPAIYAWRDHGNGINNPDMSVEITNFDIMDEGRFIVGCKVTDNGDGTFRYEYAIFNINSDQSGAGFSIPRPAGVNITNAGFKDVDYHSGELYDNTDWSVNIASDSITWSGTQTFAQNQNANALRWGTMYNFWFDADAAPTDGTATIGLFKPGTFDSTTGTVKVPGGADDCPCDFNTSGAVDVVDLLGYLALWFENDAGAEYDGVPGVDVLDLLSFLGCWYGACDA